MLPWAKICSTRLRRMRTNAWGSRLCTRYRRIKVAYLDASFTPCKKSFSGFDAQIVQHEIDHCAGVVI